MEDYTEISSREEFAAIVSKDTGEVFDHMYRGDRILRSKSMEGYSEMQETTAKSPITNFTKQNNDELRHLLRDLSLPESKFLFGCLSFLGYEDNCIKNERGNPMQIDDIAERIGLSRSSAFRAAESLMAQDILCKAKNSSEFQLFLCPLVGGKGNKYNKVLQTMFRFYKVRSKGMKTWAKLLGG